MYKPKRSHLFSLCVVLEYSQSLGILTNQLIRFLNFLLKTVNSEAWSTDLKGAILMACTEYKEYLKRM